MGLIHGLNPTSGWLLGVYRGLVHRRGSEVVLSILLIGTGHAASTLIALIFSFPLPAISQPTIPLAGLLAASFGLYKAVRPSHRYLGLKKTRLGVFSTGVLLGLMHGSTISLIPFIMILCTVSESTTKSITRGAWAVALHSAAAIATMMALALVVYYVIGLSFLKKIWINYDRLWGVTLAALGILFTILWLLRQ